MLLMFSRGFKDIITKPAKFKAFPGLENKFPNSRKLRTPGNPVNVKTLNSHTRQLANALSVGNKKTFF